MNRGTYRPTMRYVTDWRPTYFYEILIWPALSLPPKPKRGRRVR